MKTSPQKFAANDPTRDKWAVNTYFIAHASRATLETLAILIRSELRERARAKAIVDQFRRRPTRGLY